MVPSFKRKGTGAFIKDRLVRLGIPVIVFYFLLNPLTDFIISKMRDGFEFNFFQYWWEVKAFGFGPMWFVEALLYFTLIYVASQYFSKSKTEKSKLLKFPGVWSIIILTFILGGLTFIVRIWLPVGWVFKPLQLQFSNFVQYIALFIIGILAYQNNWLEQITFKQGIRWFWFAQVLIIMVFPLLFVLGGVAAKGADHFMGGFSWESLSYAIWEQVTGISLIIGLTGIFKRKLNKQNKVARSMSADAYTVYIIHPTLLVLLTLSLTNLHLYPLLKFIVIAPVALVFIFLAADIVRRLPLAKKIL
jgi:hypothetical protein